MYYKNINFPKNQESCKIWNLCWNNLKTIYLMMGWTVLLSLAVGLILQFFQYRVVKLLNISLNLSVRADFNGGLDPYLCLTWFVDTLMFLCQVHLSHKCAWKILIQVPVNGYQQANT